MSEWVCGKMQCRYIDGSINWKGGWLLEETDFGCHPIKDSRLVVEKIYQIIHIPSGLGVGAARNLELAKAFIFELIELGMPVYENGIYKGNPNLKSLLQSLADEYGITVFPGSSSDAMAPAL